MNREATIRRALGEFYLPAPAYFPALPPELEEWHCYASGAGHSILIVLPADYRDGADLTGKLCPAPVKAVFRRGCQVRGGYVACDLSYSPTPGLLTDPADDKR